MTSPTPTIERRTVPERCPSPVTRADGICADDCEGPACPRCYTSPRCDLELPCPIHPAAPAAPRPEASPHAGTVLATVAHHDDTFVEEPEVAYQLVARDRAVLVRVFDRAGHRAGTVELLAANLHTLAYHGRVVSEGTRGRLDAVLIPSSSMRKIIGHARRVFPEVLGVPRDAPITRSGRRLALRVR